MNLVIERPSPLAATELVACERVQGENFGCVWHHHPECEITLVSQGGTQRWIGDKLTPLLPDDLVFLGPDVPHDYRNSSPTGVGAPVDAHVIQFLPALLGPSWQGRAAMQPVQKLFQRSKRGLEVHGATRTKAISLIKRIFDASGLRRTIVLLELLDELSRSPELREIASPGFSISATTSDDRIGRACEFIAKNIDGPIYSPILAQLTGLSVSAFSRLFKRCTGRTLPRYLNELRIGRACRLLAETDQTVNQIATDCGYESLSHFQRQFTLHQGRSPNAYRAAVRRA